MTWRVVARSLREVRIQVREEVANAANDAPVFDGDAAARDIAEDADVGDAVGNPVVATDPNALDGGKLTYANSDGRRC